MTLSLKHAKTSGKSDGVDTSFIQPSDWNAEHTITAAAFTVLGRGSGAGAVSDLPLDDVGVPLGTALPFTAATIPAKYLMGFGQAISRATYADYFALVGTGYGVGDGSTTFNIPDLRGRVAVGVGNMGGGESGRINSFLSSSLGATGGVQSTSVNTSSSGTNSISFGAVTFNQTDGHVITTSAAVVGGGGTVVAQVNDVVSVSGFTNVNGSFGINVAGTSSAFGVVQPSMAVNYIVRVLK